MDRRVRVQLVVAIVLAALTANALPELRAQTDSRDLEVDLLLTNAELHLGDGQVIPSGNVAIRDDRIVGVGDFEVSKAMQSIDCKGMVICPGFIDLHNHSDASILRKATRSAMCYLMQGCTTIVTGNCGSGPIDVDKYYEKIEQLGSGPNVMHLLPQGDLREEVVGLERRKATTNELTRMKELAAKAMQDGAWGMSSGLIYVPSSFASTNELAAVAKVVGEHGGIYASHIRNEGTKLLDAVEEALEIGRRGELPVHISHFKSSGKDSWGLVRVAIETINQRRAEGQTITADQYPYTASNTSLRAILVPSWARAGDRKAMLERMKPGHPDSTRVLDAIRKKLELTDNGHRIQIATFSKRPEWAGRRLDELASQLGISTLDVAERIMSEGGASVVNHSINEQDVQYVMHQPWVAAASDGSARIPGPTVPHPRSYGTFSRKIGHYAIRENVVPLAHAIRSSTGLPAEILGLKDRGLLKAGNYADIVVMNKGEFIDRATFEKPHQYGAGIVHLFVNGQPVVHDSQATGILAGRPLRKPSSVDEREQTASEDEATPIAPAKSLQTGLLLEPPLDLDAFTTEQFAEMMASVGEHKIKKSWTSPVVQLHPHHSTSVSDGLTEAEIKDYMQTARRLFDEGKAIPVSDVGLISTQEDVIRQPMLNHISAFENDAARVYLLVQKTASDKRWSYFSILQDMTVDPPQDHYAHLADSGIKFEGTSCYKCHSSGPLAIHPTREDLVLDAKLAAALSQYIAEQPRSEFHFPEHSPKPATGKPLTLEFCASCHSEDGDRAPLYQVQSHPIRVMVDFGYMPPDEPLTTGQVAELRAWLEEK